MIMYAVYGIGFWYGINLILDNAEALESLGCGRHHVGPECVFKYSPQDLVIVFHCVLFGGLQVRVIQFV